ncbi:pyridoxamine 5'-phosphate oxidase family protein [Aquimarina sp. I32.4]|uniref:pyridoxamine 5'-phosphate oxidase family protein n=1 Tax=Aquimarina sp. I32.4 TaxID=2053903 RepID=UPI000CDF22AC|nr:pyridoxamine 5'-phosphate oxidase family protein [Aquimarina sp. I32.4]
MLTDEIKMYIDKSVLCWLATSSENNIPNVSPKEIFTYYGESEIIVANIASPQTIRNIKQNPNVCISFIDVFIQKGYQLKGKARMLTKENADFESMKASLSILTKGKYPFSSITNIYIEKVKPILAPKYIIYPETTEQQQIEEAIKQYKP